MAGRTPSGPRRLPFITTAEPHVVSDRRGHARTVEASGAAVRVRGLSRKACEVSVGRDGGRVRRSKHHTDGEGVRMGGAQRGVPGCKPSDRRGAVALHPGELRANIAVKDIVLDLVRSHSSTQTLNHSRTIAIVLRGADRAHKLAHALRLRISLRVVRFSRLVRRRRRSRSSLFRTPLLSRNLLNVAEGERGGARTFAPSLSATSRALPATRAPARAARRHQSQGPPHLPRQCPAAPPEGFESVRAVGCTCPSRRTVGGGGRRRRRWRSWGRRTAERRP